MDLADLAKEQETALSQVTAAELLRNAVKRIKKRKVMKKKKTDRIELGKARVVLDVLDEESNKIFKKFGVDGIDPKILNELDAAYSRITMRWIAKGIQHISDILCDDVLVETTYIDEDDVENTEIVFHRIGAGEALDNLTYGYGQEDEEETDEEGKAVKKKKVEKTDEDEEDGDQTFIGIPGAINYILAMQSLSAEMMFKALVSSKLIESGDFEERIYGKPESCDPHTPKKTMSREAAAELRSKYAKK